MNSLVKIFSWITQQPLFKDYKYKEYYSFIRWQLNTCLNSYPIIMSWVNGSKLIVERGMTGGTGDLYAGQHDF